MPRPKPNHKNTICSKCRNDKTYIKSNGEPQWITDCDDNGIWNGGYLCNACYRKYRYGYIQKTVTNYSTGNIAIDGIHALCLLSQAVVAKGLGVEDLNIKNDNFMWYVDMYHENHGKIDVKGDTLDKKLRGWNFHSRHKIDCDTYFCLGYDRDKKNIDVVYIIPNYDWIVELSSIYISKDSIRSTKHDYDKYKVDPKLYNDLYKSLMIFLGDKKYFGVEDIKKWLKE